MTRNLFLRNIYRFYDTVMISVLINILDITQNLFLTYLTLYPFHIYASLKINHTKTCNERFFMTNYIFVYVNYEITIY